MNAFTYVKFAIRNVAKWKGLCDEMGVLAAAKLLDQLQQTSTAVPFREKLTTRLIVRQSSYGINEK